MFGNIRSLPWIASACLLIAGGHVLAQPSLPAMDTTPGQQGLDLSGDWTDVDDEDTLARGDGPPLVQYWGIPINDAARDRALTYDPEVVSLLQHQCQMWPPTYILMSPWSVKLYAQYDRLDGAPQAWVIAPAAVGDDAGLTIWMDGRPDPGPLALHTDAGFSVGHWEHGTLVVHVTHYKEIALTRNGVPNSAGASMTLYLKRHADFLSITAVIEDPAYLAEPYILSRLFRLNATTLLRTTPALQLGCTPTVEVPDLASGDTVPNFLPGKNPSLMDVTRQYGVPLDAVLGGPQTMYPEYQRHIESEGYEPAARCQRNCCGWPGSQEAHINLQCR